MTVLKAALTCVLLLVAIGWAEQLLPLRAEAVSPASSSAFHLAQTGQGGTGAAGRRAQTTPASPDADPTRGARVRSDRGTAPDRPERARQSEHPTHRAAAASAVSPNPARAQPGLPVLTGLDSGGVRAEASGVHVLLDDPAVEAVVSLGGPVLIVTDNNRLFQLSWPSGRVNPVSMSVKDWLRLMKVKTDANGAPYFHPDINHFRVRTAQQLHPRSAIYVLIPVEVFDTWTAGVPEGTERLMVRWINSRGWDIRAERS